ncbi:SsgA family sporulation/cell division regulator [Streptomyces sp. NPDC017056]|uniref:SsgA family sporulation/cell division regulator n=1 Tax=Streptomyces sp. NPDC017056 TaxID=3364973 RepID=UPI0037BA24DB
MDIIRTPLDLDVDDDGCMRRMQADLVYDPRDACAVRLHINDNGRPVRWDFARGLLMQGILTSRWTGMGDVRIRRCDRGRLRIRLQTPKGTADLVASWPQARAFLCRTYEAVPEGREFDAVDMDAELRLLLGEAA